MERADNTISDGALQVGRLTASELDTFRSLQALAYGVASSSDLLAEVDKIDMREALAVRVQSDADPTEPVAVAAAEMTDITLPGSTSARVSALSWVATHPLHRRRGAFRQLMLYYLTDLASRPDVVGSLLYASERGLYERYGYAAFGSGALVDLPQGSLAALPNAVLKARSCRLSSLGPNTTWHCALPDLKSVQRRPGDVQPSPSMLRRVVGRQQGHQEAPQLIAMTDPSRGTTTACVFQRSIPGAHDRRTVQVMWAAADDSGVMDMWRIVNNLDLVDATSGQVPIDHQLVQVGLRTSGARVELVPGPHVKITNFSLLLQSRTYTFPIDVVLCIRQKFPAERSEVLQLRVDTCGHGDVRLADATPDVVVSSDVLARICLGATSWSRELAVLGVPSEDVSVVQRLDHAFGVQPQPWCSIAF